MLHIICKYNGLVAKPEMIPALGRIRSGRAKTEKLVSGHPKDLHLGFFLYS
jgi:hypothetical protein